MKILKKNISVRVVIFIILFLTGATIIFSAAKSREASARIEAQTELLTERGEHEVAVVLEEAVEAQRMVILLDHGLLLLLFCFGVGIYFLMLRPFKQYISGIRQLGTSGWKGLQPSGSKETVLFANNFNQIYADFLQNEQALEKERFMFHIAMENTKVIIFEYDFAEDLYSAYGNMEIGDSERGESAERVIPHFFGSHLTELVEPQFLELAYGLRDSKSFASADMRVRTCYENSSFLWGRVTVTPILDSQGQTVRLIGKITNIESEKEKELALDDLKKRDSLTGLYTREAGIRLARNYMKEKSPEEVCGIFLLDMDDFEQVNREEGSAFADAILQETASILISLTGKDDYQIRLGGDEFMVFIKNCSKSRATVLGPRIAEEIRALSAVGGEGSRISASIGMCVTEVIDEYEGLYRCAESTLKFVKENRRGTAACYLDTSRELGEYLTELYPERHEIDNIDHITEKQGALTSYALELLEKSKNLDDAVYLLLSRAGRSYGFDRVSIGEVNQEYLTCRYLYQWAADAADRQGREVYYVAPEDMQRLIHSYENGLSEEYMTCRQRNMNSVLHTAILNRGKYEGFMSFEVKQDGYTWSKEQQQLLKELSNVISSFVQKARSDSISHAKTEFLSRMSHEIRTPMNAISGMTDIALQVLDDKEKVHSCLEKIKSSNIYLLNLINDILDMSRIESGKMELNPEAGVMEEKLVELTEMLGPQFDQKGLRFTVKCSFDYGRTVRADFMRLSQVLINLLSNALKFSIPGGEVTFAAEQKSYKEGEVTLKFSVKDTGIGIPEESLDRIFNAFEQADRSTSTTYGGTGLGLSISGRIIQMMGGHLEVQSQVGEGSTFFFTLNFPETVSSECRKVERETKHESDEEAAVFAKGKRLLIVEDNDLNREIANTLLTMKGFEVEEAVNGREGVECYVSHPPHYYDAILMDIRMPVMDGLESARQIRLLEREDSRTIPIIAMTANAFDEDMRKSMESGMNGHLSKPLDIKKLLEMLRAAV